MNKYNKDLPISVKVCDFSIAETLECGQCFRFFRIDENIYNVIAMERSIVVEQKEDTLFFYNTTKEEIDSIWNTYFDLKRDYKKIKKILSAEDIILENAIHYAAGIHLINQDFFECLISFIISQNNHIPRIKSIIENISKNFGTKIGEFDGVWNYAFPTPEQLYLVTEEQFKALNVGFRAKYIVDATRRVVENELGLDDFFELPTNEAKKRLMTIYGVGPKVADCVLLFSCNRYDVFPTDVWIKRVISYFYFEDKEMPLKTIHTFASEKYGEYAGFAQQYLFHYARQNKIGK